MQPANLDVPPARARIGLIIPSSNRLSEPQFQRHAPDGVAVHFTRMRMTGSYRAPIDTLLPAVRQSALLLADARCDLIVFHCTGTSMEEGLEAEQTIVDAIAQATGKIATTTATAILAALRHFQASRVVVVSPYVRRTHERELEFLSQAGLEIVREGNLGLAGSDHYLSITPDQWIAETLARAEPSADAYLLSCTNIRALGAIEPLERALDRPVIASNQATLWHALRRLAVADQVAGLGRLLHQSQAPAMRA